MNNETFDTKQSNKKRQSKASFTTSVTQVHVVYKCVLLLRVDKDYTVRRFLYRHNTCLLSHIVQRSIKVCKHLQPPTIWEKERERGGGGVTYHRDNNLYACIVFCKELMSLLNKNQDLRQQVDELEEEILYYKAMLSVQETPASPDQQVPGLWTGEEDPAISQIFRREGDLFHSHNSYNFITFSQMFIFFLITFLQCFSYWNVHSLIFICFISPHLYPQKWTQSKYLNHFILFGEQIFNFLFIKTE